MEMNELVSEVQLRDISKTLATFVPKQGALTDHDFQYCLLFFSCFKAKLTSFRDLKSAFRRVLHTAGSAKLSVSHGTAAWNCVHGFFDQGIASSVPQIRDFFLAPGIWIELFDMFLATGSNYKLKPMKQVIVTLAKLVSQISDEATRSSLASHVIATAISMIYQSDGSFSMKLLFHVLDHFTRKGIISAPHLVLQYASQSLAQAEESSFLARAEISLRDNPVELVKILEVSQIEALLSDILDWARYPDVSSITGVLLVTLCNALRNCSSFKVDTDCSAPRLPLWVSPVMSCLQKEPCLLEIFGLYILPGLLRLDDSDTISFLDTLPLEELQQGKALVLPDVEVGITLLTLRTCMGSRLTTADGMISCSYEGSFRI